ncbi:phage tail terminator-like protein [Phenylobacterium immobile]|uniref:phage tail terminator-like protein n=1 Tax=Phenylobacterium immobile TaxID=21 RepID=UPI000AEC60DB|nr:phage tail terminator-like protein [Phenylobacterium immobile]
MASGADTFLALTDYVLTLSIGSPTLDVVMPEPGETFVPVDDEPYLEVADFPNAPLAQGLKAGRLDQGLMQITAVWPKNRGLVDAKRAADQIIAAFPQGKRLGAVKINRASWQAAPIIGAADVRVPVTISWTVSAT